MQNKEYVCCFSGHRKLPPEDLPLIRALLRETIAASVCGGTQYFGAGGALGFDTLAAQAVLELREVYPSIKLILVLPCPEQAARWSSADVQEYERIKAAADKVVYTSTKYYSGCMQVRNRHLVDNSSLCICYLAERTGGTRQTVQYAIEQGLCVLYIAEMVKQQKAKQIH